jgi:hypothetical protein
MYVISVSDFLELDKVRTRACVYTWADLRYGLPKSVHVYVPRREAELCLPAPIRSVPFSI